MNSTEAQPVKDPLEGPKLKIERAQKKIPELQEVIKRFFDSNPTEIFTERDTEGIQDWYVFRWTKDPPVEIGVIVGEIFHNLRSSLDQLACALAIKNGATKISDVYFPFAESKEGFEAQRAQRKIQRLSQEAIDVINALRPYKGGNDALWCLNKLNNVDKHQTVIGASMTATAHKGSARMIAGTTNPVAFSAQSKWNRFSREIKVFGFPSGANPTYDGEISVEIAFRNVDLVEGCEIVATLVQFINLTVQIVYGMEDRFFKS